MVDSRLRRRPMSPEALITRAFQLERRLLSTVAGCRKSTSENVDPLYDGVNVVNHPATWKRIDQVFSMDSLKEAIPTREVLDSKSYVAHKSDPRMKT